MAPWIAHLRIAEALSDGILLDKTAFAYGSLAPDSGKPNADSTAFDPPKEITHFLNHGESEDQIRDIEFYQDYVLTSPHFEDNFEDYSFRRGYFFHLLCDNLWSRRLMTTYKQLYPELIDNPNHPMWQTIKHDWYRMIVSRITNRVGLADRKHSGVYLLPIRVWNYVMIRGI